MTRAVVADEWALVRAGAEAVLRRSAHPSVIGAPTASQAISAARSPTKPVSLVVVGVTPDMNQVDATRALASIDGVKVVVLLAALGTQAVVDVLEAGALAVVERGARDLDLPEAIERVRDGRRHVSSQLLGGLFDSPADLRLPPRPGFDLTPREQAVLVELVAGRTNAEIGSRLSIAPETVKTHLTNLYAKLDVRTRSQAAAVAVRHSLV